MSNNDKSTIDIANRPSGQKDAHTGEEWSRHLELREVAETRRDIRNARDRLSQFSVRFVTEAIYGEEIAQKIFGKDGGQQLVRDVTIDSKVWHNLTDNVGGQRSQVVAQKMRDRETLTETKPSEPEKDVSQQQVELLRALLKTMDPDVVKRALTGG